MECCPICACDSTPRWNPDLGETRVPDDDGCPVARAGYIDSPHQVESRPSFRGPPHMAVIVFRARANVVLAWVLAVLLSVTLTVALPGGARAQDLLPPKSKQDRKKSKIEIELPSKAEKAAKPDQAPALSQDFVAHLIPELARYPSAGAQLAMDRIVAQGDAAVPVLRETLRHSDWRPKVGAALTLSRMRVVEAADEIAALLDDPRLQKSARTIFQALVRLDRSVAADVAFEHASSTVPRLRNAAFMVLKETCRADDAPKLRELLESPVDQTRREAFDLLTKVDSSNLDADALLCLGDEDAVLSKRAMGILLASRDPELPARVLQAALDDPPTRRSMWALVTLCEIEERHSLRLMGEDLVPMLMPRLRSLDPLVRVSGAMAVAQIALRSNDVALRDLLASEVLAGLMEPFLQNSYFRDFVPLFEPAHRRIVLITGVDLNTDLASWREAWEGRGERPLVRRDLDPAEVAALIPELLVSFKRSSRSACSPARSGSTVRFRRCCPTSPAPRPRWPSRWTTVPMPTRRYCSSAAWAADVEKHAHGLGVAFIPRRGRRNVGDRVLRRGALRRLLPLRRIRAPRRAAQPAPNPPRRVDHSHRPRD